MRSIVTTYLKCVSLLLIVAAIAAAQERPAATSNDPRVGLKPGFRDAGVAARGMQLVKSIPKPDGFFDPKSPVGTPTPPETVGGPNAAGGAPPAPTPVARPAETSSRGAAP